MTKATNHRLEVAKKKGQKKILVEKWRTRAMAAKCQRAKKGVSLSNEEEGNYESDTRDETDPDQANNKYSPPI